MHFYPSDSTGDKHTLKYFMWGYQCHAQLEMSNGADKVFNSLLPGLRPKVYLFGFLDEERDDRLPVCIEPHDGDFQPEAFSDVVLTQALPTTGSGTLYLHPSEAVAARHEERDRRTRLRQTLALALKNKITDASTVTFCGSPELVEGFLVIPVLQLNAARYESVPILVRDHQIGGAGTFCRSLAEGVVAAFLNACCRMLRQPDPGSGFESVCPEPMEALREGANSFVYAASSAGGNMYGLHGLYAAFNGISSLHYEGIESAGRIIIAKRGHADVDVKIEMQAPVSLRDFRAVRKLLELTESGLSLLSDSATVYGLGCLLPSYDTVLQNVFEIEVTSHYHWRLLHGNQTLMEVAYDRPSLPKSRLEREDFETLLRRLFPSVLPIEVEQLWNLVVAAIDQRHGTMLVISEEAQSEADRLARQSTVIRPTVLTPEIMRQVTKIDGAVLIDRKSVCFAIGTILDGVATATGASGRGARFNSAIRYTETVSHKAIAIVVSQDGSIDLVPDLRPQIDRRQIMSRLQKLLPMRDPKSVDLAVFHEIMDWFTTNRFYLLPDICTQLNEIKALVSSSQAAGAASTFALYHDFKPDPAMNDDYFLPGGT